ncbi:blast:Immediate-early protein 2 [Drosophila guanche]|uniref:Blast:Immediate-early protein 2 n=1 Tax=Drosophila guanche TaxID=7266 RepID=A0A3B0JYT1_DROGU|nr:blast:Immediate-early protein 2 [Drosophila guanche]
MERGTPLVVQSDDGQGQHTIVIRLVQSPGPPWAKGPTQCMPISVCAIPLCTMPQQQYQQLPVRQQPRPSSPNHSSRILSDRQSSSREQPIHCCCCECSTQDMPMPPRREGSRSSCQKRRRQVCYKVEYLLCPEDPIYGQQSAKLCPCNQFSDVRGPAPCCGQYRCNDSDSQAEQEFKYPMENIPRKCTFQQVICQCERAPNPQEEEEEETEETMSHTSEEQALKDDPSEQSVGLTSQENTVNENQVQQKPENTHRKDQSTNTYAQECPAAPDLEFIKTICESLGRAMVACATAAVEAASKMPPNAGKVRCASNWETQDSSYFMEQTQETTATFERPIISTPWVNTQPSINTENIDQGLDETAHPIRINTKNNSFPAPSSPGKDSAHTLRSIGQRLDVSDSQLGNKQRSTSTLTKVIPDDVAAVNLDPKHSARSSVDSSKERKSNRTLRASIQSTTYSASAAQGKSCASASGSERKCTPRYSNQSAQSSASVSKSQCSRQQTDQKTSPHGSLSATERKNSSHESIHSAVPLAYAVEQQSSPPAAEPKEPAGNGAEHKDFFGESIKNGQSTASAAERKDSPRESIESGKSTASAAGRQDPPSAAIHSARASSNAAVQKQSSPRVSRAPSLASRKGSAVAKPGAGNRISNCNSQSNKLMKKAKKRKPKEPNQRTPPKENPKKKAANRPVSPSLVKENPTNKDATSSVKERPILKPLKCCVPCKYVTYCCCHSPPNAPNPMNSACRPWFC